MSASNALEAELLKLLTGQATSIFTTTPIANLYCALVTSATAEGTPGTEVTGGSYARIQTIGKWAAVSGTTLVSNSTAIQFAAPTANWGTVVGYELWTAVTGGTMLYFDPLQTNVSVVNGGSAFQFAIGALTINCD